MDHIHQDIVVLICQFLEELGDVFAWVCTCVMYKEAVLGSVNLWNMLVERDFLREGNDSGVTQYKEIVAEYRRIAKVCKTQWSVSVMVSM